MTQREALGDWLHLFRANAYLLQSNPALLFQQAANQPASTAPALAALVRHHAGRAGKPWIRWINKPENRSACLLGLGFVDALAARAFGPERDAMGLATMACLLTGDGRHIAAALDGSELTVWNAETGEESARITSHRGAVTGCAASADGSRILVTIHRPAVMLTTPEEWYLELWDGVAGEVVARLQWSGEGVSTLAVSASGRWLAAGSTDGKVRLWRGTDGHPKGDLPGHAGAITALAFSPNGTLLVSAGADGQIVVNDLDQTRSRLHSAHNDAVTDCAVSSDGTRLATGSRDRTIGIWNLPTMEPSARLPPQPSPVTRCLFHPFGNGLVSAAEAGEVRLWDLVGTSFVVLETATGAPIEGTTVTISPCGRYIAAGIGRGTVGVWDASTGAELGNFLGHTRRVSYCRFTPDGNRLVSAAGDLTIRVWAVGDGSRPESRAAHDGWVSACAYSPDGSRIATGGFEDAKVMVWNGETGELLLTLPAGGSVHACAFSPDGSRVIATTSQTWQPVRPGEVRIWDGRSGAVLASLDRHSYSASGGGGPALRGSIHEPHLSADGRYRATVTEGGMLEIRDVRTQERSAVWWVGAEHAPIAWHPREARLAVGLDTGAVCLLALETSLRAG